MRDGSLHGEEKWNCPLRPYNRSFAKEEGLGVSAYRPLPSIHRPAFAGGGSLIADRYFSTYSSARFSWGSERAGSSSTALEAVELGR